MAEYLHHFNQQWVGDHSEQWLGGFAVVDVPDEEAALMWARRIAEGCGWPHEVRRFGRVPELD